MNGVQPGSWPIALVTGAGGGMGQVCSARLADRYALALSEFRPGPLESMAKALGDQGAQVVTTASGDLGSRQVMEPLMAACRGRLGAVVHTAGHSPQTGDWRTILDTNLVTTAKLLEQIGTQLQPGLVVVLIASMARLLVLPPNGALLAVLEEPLAPDFIERMEAFVGDDPDMQSNVAYGISKWWVAREVQRRAIPWGPAGVRIMSISPGMIHTPMGRAAVDCGAAVGLLDSTPLRRWGTPADIANAVEFILSDKGSFLTGSDILVDGGTGQVISQVIKPR